MFDTFTSPNAREDSVLFGLTLRRYEDANRLPHEFGGGVAKDPLAGGIAGLNDAIEILRQNRVVRRFDDGREILLSRRRCFAPSDMTIGKRFWSRMWRSFDQTTCALHLWYEMWRRAGQDKNKRYMPECLYERRKRTYLRNSQADAVLRSR